MSSNKHKLLDILSQSDLIYNALSNAVKLDLPNWYIGAGCIVQTVWNHFHGYKLDSFIGDIDLVYFDPTDLSFEAENKIIQKAMECYNWFSIPVDIKNQARVHLWYEDKFGYAIPSYRSSEGAIDTWPTTSTAIGLRTDGTAYHLYAPYGLDDLFSLIVRPNKVQITREIYETKVRKWRRFWPKLQCEPWDTIS